MNLGLKAKQVLVTGGSKGIGLAIAQAFAGGGADVFIAARGEALAKQEAQKISEEFKVKALGLALDVTKIEEVDGLGILSNHVVLGSISL